MDIFDKELNEWLGRMQLSVLLLNGKVHKGQEVREMLVLEKGRKEREARKEREERGVEEVITRNPRSKL